MTENAPAVRHTARTHFGGFRSGGGDVSLGSSAGSDAGSSVSAEVGGELTSLTGNRRFGLKSERIAKAETTTVNRDWRTNNLLTEQIGGDMTFTPLNGEYNSMYLAANQLGKKRAGDQTTAQSNERSEPNLYAFNGGKPEAGKFDPKKSVAELLTNPELQGRLRIADQVANPNDAARIADKLGPNEKPNIKVVYQDHSDNNPNKPQADFIVKKDGTIQVVNDHERNPDKDICVVVERAKGETDAPPAAQQKATDELVDYLAQRLADKFPYPQGLGPDGKPIANVPIEDQQNLVSDNVEKKFGNGNKPEVPNLPQAPEVPQPARDMSDAMNRTSGSGGSRNFDRGAVDNNYPQRDVPQAVNESNGVASVKNAVASVFRGENDTVRKRSDGRHQVGRYGLGSGHFGGWLSDILGIDLGDPPDMAKLQELLKKHPELRQKLAAAMKKAAQGGEDGKGTKLPEGFADKFQVGQDGNFKDQKFVDDFMNFGDKLSGTKGDITGAEVNQFMPKELQDIMATNRVEKYARDMGVQDPNKMTKEQAGVVGVAMYLGRMPSQQEMQDPSYQKYASDFANMYQMDRARQTGLGDINVSDANGKLLALSNGLVGQQLWAQGKYRNVVQGGNLGCAAAVTEVLQKAGFSYASSAGVGNLTDQLKARGWKQMPVSQAQPGDVVYGWRGNLHAGGGSGHIGIVGENGSVYHNSSRKTTWSHDNLNSVFTRRFGGNTYVLRPPDAQRAA